MATGETEQKPYMQAEAVKEHHWRQQLVGDWTYDAFALMEPGKPREKCGGA